MPLPLNLIVEDGDFSELIEVEGRLTTWPFRNEQAKDTTTKAYERVYEVDRASYTPAAALSQDPDDSSAYLIFESDPQAIGGDMVRVTRRYIKIPIDQVSYENRSFNRPSMHGIAVGSYWGASFDEGETTWLFAVRKSINGIGSIAADTKTRTGSVTRTGTNPTAVAQRSQVVLPSFTINVTGPTAGTSTFFDTSSVAAIKSAFTSRGLTDISVFKSPYKIIVRWAGDAGIDVVAGSPSANETGGSLEITAPAETAAATDTETVAETDANSLTETYAVPASVRAFSTSAPHSGNVGDYVVFWKGDKIVAISKAISASGASLTVPLEDVDGKDFSADYLAFSSGAAFRYVNGELEDCTIKITRKFYLPGVSPGITTGADIPQTTTYKDAVGWLTAINAGVSYAAIASKSGTWEGPFLVKQIEEVQMSDALESRSVNA